MTKDNVSLYLTSVIYYRITSPHRAAFGISDVRQALVERTQTTLRHVVGSRILQDVVERREEIMQDIRDIVERIAEGWGIEVESMLIKDMIFSEELQESLSMAAQSKRTGEARVITARAEVESAKLMRQAADILSSAPAMQIRSVNCAKLSRCLLLVQRLTLSMQISRGHAAYGQVCQLQGHFPARAEPDCPRIIGQSFIWRRPISESRPLRQRRAGIRT